MPSLPLQIDLPSSAQLQTVADGVSIVTHPGTRTPLRIDILRDATKGSFLEPNPKTRALTPALQLRYREQVQPGGSGGDERILDGALRLAGESYRVSCYQQSEEAPPAHPCLTYLTTLRPFAPGP